MSNGMQILVTDPDNPELDLDVKLFRELPVELGRHLISEEGWSFVHSDYHAGLGAGANKDYLIVTPAGATDNLIHLTTGEVIADTAPLLVSLYENPTYATPGTAVTAQNRKRDSTRTHTALIYEDPTTVSVGGSTSLMFRMVAGTLQAGGILGSQEGEWMLKKGNTYLLRITNNAVGVANLTAHIEFHEVPYKL